MIPFVDLKLQNDQLAEEIQVTLENLIASTSFIGGKPVSDFNTSFSKYLGVDHFIGCANGTDSLEILLEAMGIRDGDEVIVPAFSWISTSEAVSRVGAKPVFVDIHPDHYTIDASLIEQKITPKTKAIIPVHLYGHPADMDPIMDIAERFGLKVLEDCAQAHGATYNDRMIGTIGTCSSFSFYPGKNLGAFGDAGGMGTNDEAIATVAKQIANHGQEKKHTHIREGRNSRLDTIQAAILDIKLKKLDTWNAQRIQVAQWYEEELSQANIKLPKVNFGKHVFHLYVIRTQHREVLIEALEKEQIGYAIHYPTALPFLDCYKDRDFNAEDFPEAIAHQNEILSLPMYPGMTREQVALVAEVIKKTL